MSGHWNAPHPPGSPGTIIPPRWHLLRPFWQQLFDLCCCVQLFSHLRYKVSLASKDHILLFLASWKLHSAISHTTLGAWGGSDFLKPTRHLMQIFYSITDRAVYVDFSMSLPSYHLNPNLSGGIIVSLHSKTWGQSWVNGSSQRYLSVSNSLESLLFFFLPFSNLQIFISP